MSVLLEIIALTPDDARAAEAGGADRIELVGTMADDGLSPEPALVSKVRLATSLPVRPMVRLRAGFGTDGAEITRLRGLIASYVSAGADGMVFGFLNGRNDIDIPVCAELLEDGDWPWTFHRAMDTVRDFDDAWHTLTQLPRVDTVLTAGSADGVEQGLDELIARAKDPAAASLLMVGGGLLAEHIPWLARAGVRKFHVGSRARQQQSFEHPVDEARVHTWRVLIDQETRRTPQNAGAGGSLLAGTAENIAR